MHSYTFVNYQHKHQCVCKRKCAYVLLYVCARACACERQQVRRIGRAPRAPYQSLPRPAQPRVPSAVARRSRAGRSGQGGPRGSA